MIKIKKMSDLTFGEATELWNAGFEGYVYDMNKTVDDFIQRFGLEDLLPSLSVVAYVNHEPAGFILNGVRNMNGKKVSWNGGTGVATKFRRQGIGKAMMEAVLSLYKENGIDVATLEAAKSNEKAINLYKHYGYEVIDELTFLQHKGSLEGNAFSTNRATHYEVKRGLAQDARRLSILNENVPWQTHWNSLRKDGELVVLLDKGEEAAYFLYKRIYDTDGRLVNNILYSTGIQAGRKDTEELVKYGLREIWHPAEETYARTTFNFRCSNKEVVKILKEAGFTPFAEQVYMTKKLK